MEIYCYLGFTKGVRFSDEDVPYHLHYILIKSLRISLLQQKGLSILQPLPINPSFFAVTFSMTTDLETPPE